MNGKYFFVLIILAIALFSGCSDSKTASKEAPLEFKEVIAHMMYIDRLEPNGQRTIVAVVSPKSTRQEVKDLCEFLINDSKENKIWIEVWDDLATLQKGSEITEADKVTHYIVNVRIDKASNKVDYYWERNYS
jgi:hypothetical protein